MFAFLCPIKMPIGMARMNISIKGRSRFERSQGLAGEAMKGNPETPVILRVDASKLSFERRLDRTYIPL